MERAELNYSPDERRHAGPGKQNTEFLMSSEKKERLFEFIVNKNLFEDVVRSMVESGFSDMEIYRIKNTFDTLPLSDQKKFLAVPWELREKKLDTMRTMLDNGTIMPEEVVHKIYSEAVENKFDLGYHLSSREIEKRKGKNGLEWNIDGKETDARDDMKMAFYSSDYASLYRGKHTDHLYVVRAKGDYKFDSSNNWGRALKLPIVAELDMRYIEEEMRRAGEYKERKAA